MICELCGTKAAALFPDGKCLGCHRFPSRKIIHPKPRQIEIHEQRARDYICYTYRRDKIRDRQTEKSKR